MDRYDVIIKQLEAEIHGYKRDYESATKQKQKLRSILAFIAEKLCDSSYGNNQLGGKNAMLSLSDEELRDFIVQNVLKQKINFTENIKDLQRIYLNENREKENLANRILELEDQLRNHGKSSVASKIEVSSNNYDEMTGEIIEQTQKKEIHIAENGAVYDVDREYTKLSTYHLALIQVLGERGFSEANDIIRETSEMVKIKDTLVRANLDELVKSDVINQTKNPTPIRKNLYLYCLSELGQKLFTKHFNKQPIKSEMQTIAEQHDNINHGYGIKDLAELCLSQQGRTRICYDSKKNQFPLPGMPGQRYVPDVTSTLDGKTTEYWEYELGHHTQEDFNQKLLKASVLTNELYIITPDKGAKDKIISQIEEFMTYLVIADKKVKLKVYYGTMRELMDGVLFSNSNCVLEMK